MSNIIKCTVTKSKPGQDLGLGLEEYANHRIYVASIGGLVQRNCVPVGINDQLLEVNNTSVRNKQHFPNGLKDVEKLLRKEWYVCLKVKKGGPAPRKIAAAKADADETAIIDDDDSDDETVKPTIVYRKVPEASPSTLIDDSSYHARKRTHTSKWVEESRGRWGDAASHSRTTGHVREESPRKPRDSSSKSEKASEPAPSKEVSSSKAATTSNPEPAPNQVSDDDDDKNGPTRRPKSSRQDAGDNDRGGSTSRPEAPSSVPQNVSAAAATNSETDTTVSSSSFAEDTGFMPLAKEDDDQQSPEPERPKKPRSNRSPRPPSTIKKPRSSSSKNRVMISNLDFGSDGEESLKSCRTAKSTKSTKSTKSKKKSSKSKKRDKTKDPSDEDSLKSYRSTKSTKSTKSRKKSKSKKNVKQALSDDESLTSHRSTKSTKSTKSRKKSKSKKHNNAEDDDVSLKSYSSTKSSKSTKSKKKSKSKKHNAYLSSDDDDMSLNKSYTNRHGKRTKPRSRRPNNNNSYSLRSNRSERPNESSLRSTRTHEPLSPSARSQRTYHPDSPSVMTARTYNPDDYSDSEWEGGSNHSCMTNLIDPGDLMKIHGFVSMPEMNGMTVEVIRKSKGTKKKRWDVRVVTEDRVMIHSTFDFKRLISVSVDNLKHFI